MAADGSLNFDTKINTDGFKDGVSSIKKASDDCVKAVEEVGESVDEAFSEPSRVTSLKKSVEDAKDKVSSLLSELDKLGDEKIPTEDFKFYSSEIEKAEKKLDDLLYRQEKMKSLGVSKNSNAWKGLQYDIEQTTRKVNDYKVSLSQLNEEESYVSGRSTEAYKQKYIALEEANVRLEIQKKKLAELEAKEAERLRQAQEVKQAEQEAAKEAERLKAIGENAEVSNSEIVELISKLKALKARQAELESAGVGLGHTEYDKNISEINRMNALIKEYKESLDEAEEPTSRFSKICSSAMGVAKKAISGLATKAKELGKGALKSAGNGVKSFVSKLTSMEKGANKASQSILKLSNMFKLMLIRLAMRSAIEGVKDGLQNLVQYSSSTNASISSLMASLTYLKNSFATAFAPILSTVVPILNTLIGIIAAALSYINQFFSALGGSTTFVKAKKANEDYAKSLGGTSSATKKATSETKKILAPFDELVQLQKESADNNSSSGGSSSASASDMFETVSIDKGIGDFADKLKSMFANGDWKGIGSLIGEKINEAVQNFTDFISWDNVGAKIAEVITAFTTIFNSLVSSIDWYAVGNMFATGINTIAMTLYLLLTGIDWVGLGAAFATGLNGLVQNADWSLVGRTIGAYFQMSLSMMYGVVTNFDFKGLGTGIGTGLNGIVSEIDWGMIGTTLGTGLTGALNVVSNLALTFDWQGLGGSLSSSINNFVHSFDWASVSAISTLIIGILDTLIEFVAQTDWFSLGDRLTTALISIDWGGMVNKLYSFIGTSLGGLAQFVGGVLSKGIKGAYSYFKSETENCGGNIVAGIFSGIIKAFAGIVSWIWNNMTKPFVDGLGKAFGIQNLSGTFLSIGKNLWAGFTNGIKSAFAGVNDFVKTNITDPFVNGIKGLLGIHSPSTVLEEIGGYTVEGFNGGVSNKQSSTQNAVSEWASGIVSWFSNKLGISGGDSIEAQKWAGSTMDGFNKSISAKQKNSQSVMESWAENIRKWFVGTGDSKGVNEASWSKFATDIIKAFGNKVLAGYTENKAIIEKWALDIRNWFVGDSEAKGVNKGVWSKLAKDIIDAFKSKIQSSYTETKAPVENWAKNVKEWFWGSASVSSEAGLYKDFYDMAKRINEGFAKGIGDFAHLAKNAIRNWASELVEAAKDELDIHSPSKVFKSIGGYVVEGFDEGIESANGDSVQDWLNGIQEIAEKAGIKIPVSFDIPNLSDYLPSIALGKVSPPSAGEINYSRGVYSNSDSSESLLSRLEDMIDRLDTDKPIQLVLNCNGSLSSLVRELKPELDKESNRKGISLVVVGGA